MDLDRLNVLWKVCWGLTILAFIIAAMLSGQFAEADLISLIIIFSISAILFSGLFFLSSAIVAPELRRFVLDDNTKVQGPEIIHETTILESGDDEVDKWMGRYVATRNIFGLSVIPLLILAGLFLFG